MIGLLKIPLKSQVGSDKSFREGNQSGAALPTAAAADANKFFCVDKYRFRCRQIYLKNQMPKLNLIKVSGKETKVGGAALPTAAFSSL